METTAESSRVRGTSHAQPSRQLMRMAVDGESWTCDTPEIQAAGVDTLEVSFDVEVSEAMWQRLEQERQIAAFLMKERRCVHVPEWLGAQIHPTGARGGYRFLLETPTFAIKLLRGVPNRPPIYVELCAFGLHTHAGGELAACEVACAYLRDVLLADQDPQWALSAITLDTARCSRLDLYVDWQGGWRPDFETGDERQFVKRVHAEVARRSADGRVTGYEIGKGVVRARIYDKSAQMRKEHIEWYAALLAERNGERYDPACELWRLEFQLRREGVKGFRLYARPEMSDPDEVLDAELEAEDLPHLHSVRKALHWAGQIWAYLTKRWLRLVQPSADPNRGRWPEHPTWAALRQAFPALAMQGAPSLLEPQVELIRAARYSGYRRLLDRMAVGVLTTLEALDTDPGAALVAYVAYLARIAGRIKRRQKQRVRAWERQQAERAQKGRPLPIAPDRSRGLGARLDALHRAEQREQLLHMALGVFTSAGVVQLRLHREGDVANVGDLLMYSLGELDAVAAAKGGIRMLLDEKWAKVYKAAAPRGMFARGERRAA
jgi:hypothetical protein